MTAPINELKLSLSSGRMATGIWLALGSAISAEVSGRAGFDWCLIDGEHMPYDITSIATQVAVLEGLPCQTIVRVPAGEDWILKQVLDLGVQSVMVPMVDTAAQARAVVAATRYPPDGHRGMGGLGRATHFGAISDYPATANSEICVIVQIESATACKNIEEIAAVDGVDAMFIGPADLSASMGHTGNPGAPEVVAAIKDALERIRSSGKTPGILTFDVDAVAYYRDLGVGMLGVGADILSLASSLKMLKNKVS